MIGARNVRGGIVLLSAGLVMGLALSVYAFVPIVPHVPAALDRYDDLPRRLLRLAHIAAIMLPLINIVLGAWIDRLRLSPRLKAAASHLLLWGALLLPAALALQAVWPAAAGAHIAGPPAVAFCLGVFITGAGVLRMDPAAWPR